jgi:hypothetical protein
MEERALEWFDILGRALLWAGVAVLGLSFIVAIAMLTSDSALGFLDEDMESQGRGILAIASFAGGLSAGGILAGLGALVRLRVAAQRDS